MKEQMGNVSRRTVLRESKGNARNQKHCNRNKMPLIGSSVDVWVRKKNISELDNGAI